MFTITHGAACTAMPQAMRERGMREIVWAYRLSFVLAARQLLGFDVDPVLSVHFSNHTGFPTIAGTRMSGDELLELLRGMEANELLGEYTHLLTGNASKAQGTAEQVWTVQHSSE